MTMRGAMMAAVHNMSSNVCSQIPTHTFIQLRVLPAQYPAYVIPLAAISKRRGARGHGHNFMEWVQVDDDSRPVIHDGC
jgi:hypothetical protein